MDKSTPIAHLRREEEDGGGGEDAASMMEHMVSDVEGDYHQGMPGQQMPGYQSDPEEDYRQHSQHPQHPQHHPSSGGPPPGYGGGYPPPPGYRGGPLPPRGMMGGGGGGPPQGGQGGQGLENKTFVEKLMAEAKEPLLVSVLVIMLSSNQVGSLLARFLPMADKNPLVGLLVRAAIAGAAFWLLRRFIPSK